MTQKMKLALAAGLLLALGPIVASATIIAPPNLGESNYDGGPDFPSPEQTIGTFIFDLNGETIVSAMLSGTFGNSSNPTSAGVDVFADGDLVAQCVEFAECYTSGALWTFDFVDFSSLLDGSLEMTFVQTSEFITRLGEISLVIETVPEPASLALLGLGLVGMGMRRRTKA